MKQVAQRVKGFFSALLVLTLAILILVPLGSEFGVDSNSSYMPYTTMYLLLLLAWVLLAFAFIAAYFISAGNKEVEHIALQLEKGVDL
ncbi:MAG: hypothetical protein ACE5J2_06580 [Nitrososphaerales archaeon]